MSEAELVKDEPNWDSVGASGSPETTTFERGIIKVEFDLVKEEAIAKESLQDSTCWCSDGGAASHMVHETKTNVLAKTEINETSDLTHEEQMRYTGCVVKVELELEPVTPQKSQMVPDTEEPRASLESIPGSVSLQHETLLEKPYVCDNCSKAFTQKRYLVQHMKVHLKSETQKKRNHNCNLCNKKFIQLGHLRAHKQSHTGEKPYSCKICQKVFTRLDTLTRHERYHVGGNLKPYSCEICNKKFAYPNSIKMHRLIKHTAEKPFNCETCKKKFGTLGNLKRHVRIHSADKPYGCEVCGKMFSDPTNLKQHKLTHTGNKTHCCVICSKQFLTVGQLNRHKRIHEGLKPFSCEVCKKRFTESGSLKKHRNKFHVIEAQ